MRHSLHFGPFRLDRQRGALWRGDQRLPLRPQAAVVLQYLAERPGQPITSQELLEQNWRETHVTDTVLRVCIRDIRRALKDYATAPQYIQTTRGQGYRFCGQVDASVTTPVIASSVTPHPELIGRE